MNKRNFDFEKTPKQEQAIEIFRKQVEVLLEGGSRSGKTFIEIYATIARASMYPESKHIVLRKVFNHAKITLWYQTIPAVFKIAFPGLRYKENKSDWFFELRNGSQIWIGGTDDKERIEKILGSEWATIFLNEISQLPYSTYEMLKTRLNPPQGMKPLYLMDQNPPSRSHWSHVKFHQLLNPETRQKLSETDIARQTFFFMNPYDNKKNLSDGYIETLESLSETKKRRFLNGEYTDDSERALWKREWIIKNRIEKPPEKLDRIVVAVDPAVTGNETSDDTGIIVVGEKRILEDYHYYVLADRTYHGNVSGWGQEAVNAYSDYNADKVIGETNQGGDLVEMNIRNYDRQISFDSVRATRGKAVRAEPVADLYRRGFVHHVGEFVELEDQLCTWTPEVSVSPNNLDAVVWGISYLAKIGDVGRTIKTTGW